MRRFVSLWLPFWSTDRLNLSPPNNAPNDAAREAGSDAPLVLVETARGTVRIAAVSDAAKATGLAPGMTFAERRSVCPGLSSAEIERAADARTLRRLGLWCERYSPYVAVDGDDGLMLDISGSAHLFGGEEAMLRGIARQFSRLGQGGVSVRAAAADTPAAARAIARYGEEALTIAPAGAARRLLAPLPVAALGLAPETVEALQQVGLKRIGDVITLPRAPLVHRYGEAVARRIDQALGRLAEPISPLRPAPAFRVRLAWPEPIGHHADIEAAAERLVRDLFDLLEREHRGARRLRLSLLRVDGRAIEVAIATGQATRRPAHVMQLLRERLDGLDIGFGIDEMILACLVHELLPARQLSGPEAAPHSSAAGEAETVGKAADGEALAELLDRLRNRIGGGCLFSLRSHDSHWPERAEAAEDAVATIPGIGAVRAAGWPVTPPRPVRLFTPPQPLAVEVAARHAPPLSFRWRGRKHRVVRAEEPERILPEWWRAAAGIHAPMRDYYRIEDEAGGRFWIFRTASSQPASIPATADRDNERAHPGWYLHGLFA